MQSFCFNVIPVDHDRNPHKVHLPTVKLNMADPLQSAVLLDLAESGNLAVLWLAVPCGTCSRAREIVLPGVPNAPKPLRSDSYPYGLPHLTGRDLDRVKTANAIYSNVSLLIKAVLTKNPHCIVVVENPTNSILWLLDEFSSLLNAGFSDTDFQHCKWNVGVASRAKWTKLRSNCLELQSLSGPCELGHYHLPWGIKPDGSFATSSEAEYPKLMCEAISEVLHMACCLRGWTFSKLTPAQAIEDLPNKRARAALAKQSRKRHSHSVISEFKHVMTVPVDTPVTDDLKILRFQQERGENGSEESFPVAGFWRTPEEFVAEALKISHPMDSTNVLPEVLASALAFNLSESKAVIVDTIMRSMKSLVKLVYDTKDDETKLHSKFDPLFARIYAGKKFTAMKYYLEKHRELLQDDAVIDDIISGFKLTGWEPYYGAFHFEPSPPEMHEVAVKGLSTFNNLSIIARTRSSGCEESDSTLWEAAKDEAQKGWLVGPYYDIDELSQFVGPVECPHLSRRFPIQQSGKVRAIDDLSESSINMCHGSYDKLWLMDSDFIGGTIQIIQRCLTAKLDTVTDYSGSNHTIDARTIQWSGTTVDLKSAYKQLCVKAESRWASCISVFDPGRQCPALFGQATLPFGASASVLAFNRVARFLWTVVCSELRVVILNYFDDYPVLAPSDVSELVHKAVKMFFSTLGWCVSEDQKKDTPMNQFFVALGVKFDMTNILSGQSVVENLQKRTEDMIALLTSCLENKCVTYHQVEVIRGRLQFMESQLFGRAGKSFLFSLSSLRSMSQTWSEAAACAITQLVEWLKTARPRFIDCDLSIPPLVVFSDGACEDFLDSTVRPKTTIGLVVFDRMDNTVHYVSKVVPNQLVDYWLLQGKRQLVTEAELLPVLIARLVFFTRLNGRRVLYFIDSDPARSCLIKGSSESESCNEIVRAVHIADNSVKGFNWYCRVPTKSNPADAASRLQGAALERTFNAVLVDCSLPTKPEEYVLNPTFQ